MQDKLVGYLAEQREAVIAWQTELTSRPAMGPENQGQGEELRARWLLRELQSLGVDDVQEFPAIDSRVPCGFRPNIAAKIHGRSERTLWIISHLDIVPAGDLNLWQQDPFKVKVDGDYVIGRGVEDNQQAIVTSLLLIKALKAKNIQPDLSLGLLFVSDEETGMTYGLPHVLNTAPNLIQKDDLVIVPDLGNSQGTMVQIAEKSCLWLKFTATGKQCHASTPQEGINTLVVASTCILELEQLYRAFHKKDPLYSPSWSTFVPSKKEANVENINTVPGRDVFYLDCRVLPEYDLNKILDKCREIADDVAARFRAKIDVEVVHKSVAPTPTAADSPVVLKLLASLNAILGKEGVLSGSGGQTVASALRSRGINAAVWATLVPNAHTPNERSSISGTINDAKVIGKMLFD